MATSIRGQTHRETRRDRRRLKALATVIFGEAGSEVAGGRQLKYTRRHLEHATRFREVKEAAERWLRGG